MLDSRAGVWTLRIVFFGALLAAWHLLARIGLWPEYLFPSPTSVLEYLTGAANDKRLVIAIGASLRRLFEGYAIALVIGVIVGVTMATVRPVKVTLGLLVLGLQTLPSICWLPLALLWFGLSEGAILFVVVMGAVMSIAQATEDGIRNTPPIHIRAARNLGARGWRLYTSVVIPAAFPFVVSGMKLGWSFAWRSLMAGELLYALPGLGNLLMMGRELNDMSQVIGVIIVILTIGLLTDKILFGSLERKVRERWGLT